MFYPCKKTIYSVNPEPEIRVHGTQYMLESLNADDGLLIVDDVFSTGHSVEAVISRLDRHLKRNMPREVKIATLYQHPAFNKTRLKPDYVLHATDTTGWCFLRK